MTTVIFTGLVNFFSLHKFVKSGFPAIKCPWKKLLAKKIGPTHEHEVRQSHNELTESPRGRVDSMYRGFTEIPSWVPLVSPVFLPVTIFVRFVLRKFKTWSWVKNGSKAEQSVWNIYTVYRYLCQEKYIRSPYWCLPGWRFMLSLKPS